MFVCVDLVVRDGAHRGLVTVALACSCAAPCEVATGDIGESSVVDVLPSVSGGGASVGVGADVGDDDNEAQGKFWPNDGCSAPGLTECESTGAEEEANSGANANGSLYGLGVRSRMKFCWCTQRSSAGLGIGISSSRSKSSGRGMWWKYWSLKFGEFGHDLFSVSAGGVPK